MTKRIDGDVLRSVMRHVPSPVTVVTVCGRDEIRGITIGSFTSASLRPPLVCFNVARDAQAFDALTTAEQFAVHILNDRQAGLSDHFATPDLSSEDQFDGIAYRIDADGTPILLDVAIVLTCRRHAVYDAGDHAIVLGEVVGIEGSDAGQPMLYYDRTYRRIGDQVQPTVYDPVGEDAGRSMPR